MASGPLFSVSIAEKLWYLPNAVSLVIFPKAAASEENELRSFTKLFLLQLFYFYMSCFINVNREVLYKNCKFPNIYLSIFPNGNLFIRDCFIW